MVLGVLRLFNSDTSNPTRQGCAANPLAQRALERYRQSLLVHLRFGYLSLSLFLSPAPSVLVSLCERSGKGGRPPVFASTMRPSQQELRLGMATLVYQQFSISLTMTSHSILNTKRISTPHQVSHQVNHVASQVPKIVIDCVRRSERCINDGLCISRPHFATISWWGWAPRS